MTEQELIQGCQKGKAAHQRELVSRFAPVLLTVCRRYVPDLPTAEDALQETFIRVFRHISGYEPTGSFEGWLRRIAVTTSLKLRKKMRFATEFPAEKAHLPETVLLPEVFPRLGAEEILRLIEGLPDGYRTVFNLSIIDGYSHREIASLLHITESASRSHLARARKQLIQRITQQEKIML